MITELLNIQDGGCVDTHLVYLCLRKVGDVADFSEVQTVTIFKAEVNREGECSCTQKLEPNFVLNLNVVSLVDCSATAESSLCCSLVRYATLRLIAIM
jgi:hypothetical protein